MASALPIEYPPEWPVYTKEAVARATELLEAGLTFDYGYGEQLASLEAAFEKRFGYHALAVNSGTSALLAAYYSLGLSPRDEVIVPTFTFYATATPLFLLRLAPVLCDAGGPDGNVTAETIAQRLTSRVRAVVVTHLFGWPCEMDDIVALCRRHGLALIEDCSHAHGSTYRGRPVGTFGDLAIFSIGGHKMISGGLGGVLLSRSREHHELACLLANFRPRTRHSVGDERLRAFVETGLGGNLRISPVAAVLAASHLEQLDELAATKRRNVLRLLEGLSELPGIQAFTHSGVAENNTWYGANVRVAAASDTAQVIERLRQAGLRVRRPATVPLHRMPLFRSTAPPTWTGPEQLRWIARTSRQHYPVADQTYDRWIAYPATFLHDEAGTIVEPYLELTRRALRGSAG
jgi:perosamine synthetase